MQTALKQYPISLAAGQSRNLPLPGSYFRIQSSTGPVDVYGDQFGTMPGLLAGEGLNAVPFTGLTVFNTSGAQNDLVLLIASSEFISNRQNGTFDLTPAALAALESIDLNAATTNILTRPLNPGLDWNNSAAVAANTPINIFTPGANANGAIIYMAEAADLFTGAGQQTFIAKNAAPSSIADGVVIAQSKPSGRGAGDIAYQTTLQAQTRIGPGLGLYFISNTAGASVFIRSVRYTLL